MTLFADDTNIFTPVSDSFYNSNQSLQKKSRTNGSNKLRTSFCSGHLKNDDKLCIRVWFSFSFKNVFHAKSDTTNNHRKLSNDMSYRSHLSRDSNNFEKF